MDDAYVRETMILIVDDHEDTRDVLARMLRFEGYEAVAVSSGEEALAFLAANKPSLIILDYNMPSIDGLTLFRQIRKDSRVANVPVIMFSASGGDLKEKSLKAGINAFIVKASLDWADLRREIHRLAGAGNPAANPPVPPQQRTQQAG
jgi:CheY-like chemotaxis protein